MDVLPCLHKGPTTPMFGGSNAARASTNLVIQFWVCFISLSSLIRKKKSAPALYPCLITQFELQTMFSQAHSCKNVAAEQGEVTEG